MLRRFAASLLLIALVACGGGGDAPAPVTISNLQYTPAAANARLGNIPVSGSIDFVAGADIASLHLADSLGTNSTVVVSAPGQRSGRLTIPSASIPGNPAGLYTFTIWLRDSAGTESNRLSGQIEIRRVPPVANAGPDVSVPTNVSIELDGSASTNVNGTPTTYTWRVANLPATGSVTLDNPTAVSTGATCTVAGLFDIELRVNDWFGDSAPDLLTLNCTPPGKFGLASTEEQVRSLAGTPTAILSVISTYYDWQYSDSLTYVRFSATGRRVIGWRSYDIPLPVSMPFRPAGTGATRIAVGITKDDVARIQGTPLAVDDGGQLLPYEQWAYDKTGLTYIRFSKTTGLVIEYRNHDGSLNT